MFGHKHPPPPAHVAHDSHLVCPPKAAAVQGTKHTHPPHHVDTFPDSIADEMREFGFFSTSKAKLHRVKDGDTMVFIVFFTIKDLGVVVHDTYYHHDRARINCVPCSTSTNDTGFYALVDVRVSGIDAAEHNTERGRIAIEFVNQWFEKRHKLVTLEFKGPDKYGRTLAVIKDAHGHSLGEDLVNYKHAKLGRVAQRYDGGTKGHWLPDNKYMD